MHSRQSTVKYVDLTLHIPGIPEQFRQEATWPGLSGLTASFEGQQQAELKVPVCLPTAGPRHGSHSDYRSSLNLENQKQPWNSYTAPFNPEETELFFQRTHQRHDLDGIPELQNSEHCECLRTPSFP